MRLQLTSGNGRDKQALLAQRTRSLLAMPHKARVDALIAQDDAKAAVRAMPAHELYQTIMEVGLDDTTELVQLASPAQFRSFVDLGAWKKDELLPNELLTWLRAAQGDDDEEFDAKLTGMDLELLELLLRNFVVIYDLEEDPDANPPGVTMESPEGKYLLEFKVEGAALAALRSLLGTIIAKDPFAAGRLFEAVRWEIDTELSETAYKFRTARLGDLGFPELYDALSLFSYVDPGPDAASATPAGPALARAHGDVDFVAQALAGLTPPERENVEEELRYVANQALVAEGADPGDLEALKRVAAMVRDYLSLGIEQLCDGDAAKAAEAVRDHELKHVFKVGFSLTLKLKFRVERMLKEPFSRLSDAPLLLADEADVVKALLRKRPLKAVRVPGAEPMPFRARRELHETSRVLDRAESQLRIFRSLLGGSKEAAAKAMAGFEEDFKTVGADRVFGAAVAHAILDGAPMVAPLTEADFKELLPRLFDPGPALKGGVVEAAVKALSKHGDEAQLAVLVRRVADEWVQEWGEPFLSSGSVDPKHVHALPIAGHKAL